MLRSLPTDVINSSYWIKSVYIAYLVQWHFEIYLHFENADIHSTSNTYSLRYIIIEWLNIFSIDILIFSQDHSMQLFCIPFYRFFIFPNGLNFAINRLLFMYKLGKVDAGKHIHEIVSNHQHSSNTFDVRDYSLTSFINCQKVASEIHIRFTTKLETRNESAFNKLYIHVFSFDWPMSRLAQTCLSFTQTNWWLIVWMKISYCYLWLTELSRYV